MAPSFGRVGPVLLTVVHYAVPLAVVTLFFAIQLVQFCSVTKTKTRAPTKHQRWAGIALTLALVVSFVVEGILYFSRALHDHAWWAPQHLVLYLIFSVVSWAIVGINYAESPTISHAAFTGAWLLGLAGEITITALTASTTPHRNGYNITTLILNLIRVVILVLLILTAGGIQFTRNADAADDGEGNALLGEQPAKSTSYGSTPGTSGMGPDLGDDYGDSGSDSDDDDDQAVKEQQRKRLEDEGVWAYLMGFSIFLKLLNPKGYPKIQVYYTILALYIIWVRVQNIIVPNQIGIITRKLTMDQGTGILPWKEIAVWAFLRWLGGSAGLNCVQSWVQARIDNFCYKRVNEFAFNHVMSLSMDFHDSKDSGEILKSVEQGSSISDLLDLFVFDIAPMLFDIVIGVVYVTYLFDIYIALIALITGLTYSWANVRLRTLYVPRRRDYMKKSREATNLSYEAVGNWQTVSYFNRAQYEQNRYAGAVDALIGAEYRYLDLSNLTGAILSLLMQFGHISAMYLAAWRVAKGVNDVGSFVTLVTYWSTLTSPLQRLAYQFRNISNRIIDAERLLILIQTKPSVTSAENAPDLQTSGGEVQFENVNFSYDPRKPILKDVTFTAKPGQTIALVGETGGGKSTTLKLLGRYYDATEGSIKIDGQNIKDVTLDSLREAIGVVPQDPALFNRSILENVRYARLDATDEEIYEACRAAAIHDKIVTFPDQYNSKVGERGIKVSGGEKQRIAVARVILRDPKIVVLDEATSAVDSSTEEVIQDAFKQLSQSRTMFVIAHRLSTIVEADLIMVMEGGEIVERGTHEELMKRNGKYMELWRKQTKQANKQAAAALQDISTSSTARSSNVDLMDFDVKDGLGTKDSSPTSGPTVSPSDHNEDEGREPSESAAAGQAQHKQDNTDKDNYTK